MTTSKKLEAPKFEERVSAARDANIADAIRQISDAGNKCTKWLHEKIKKHAERIPALRGRSAPEKLVNALFSSFDEKLSQEEARLAKELIAAPISKDPGRQAIHQKVALESLSGWLTEWNMHQLGTKEEGDALWPHAGEMLKKTNARCKSIDFLGGMRMGPALPGITSGFLSVGMSHKHTKESGGAQDNQFADLRAFVEEARAPKKEKQSEKIRDSLLVAVPDGEFYDMCRINSKDSRLLDLKSAADDAGYEKGHVVVARSEDVPAKVLAFMRERAAAAKKERPDYPFDEGFIEAERRLGLLLD